MTVHVPAKEANDVNEQFNERNEKVLDDKSDNEVWDGFACPVAGCRRKMKLKRSIKRHVTDYHGQPTPGGYSHPRVRCLVCQKVCLNTSNFGAHHASQHGKQKRRFENIELKSQTQVLI